MHKFCALINPNARMDEIVYRLCIYNDIMVNEKVRYKQKNVTYSILKNSYRL